MTQAVPTYAHMAMATLLERGDVKYIVSQVRTPLVLRAVCENMKIVADQNVDGLHRRSGVRAESISELHGNCYLETCWSCDKVCRQCFLLFVR